MPKKYAVLPLAFQEIVCLKGGGEILQTNGGVDRYFVQLKTFNIFPERGG
ncbi:hypothetical protein [Holospora undulata]|nr:hypothetical protein [Holospora undulata]